MFRTNRTLLAIPLVSLVSIAAGLGGLPAAAAPVRDPGAGHTHGAIGRLDVAYATGTLMADIDPTTVVATPTRDGTTCRLTDRTTLTLTGAVAGTVEGSTTADVKAPCSLATTTPPGTYPVTFALSGTFRGKVADDPVLDDAWYSGSVRTGGEVSAVLVLAGRASAVLDVRARFGADGTYEGVTVTRGSR